MLKKSFFTLSVLFLLVGSLKAQLGVRVGANISSYSASGSGVSINSDSKVGFHIGITNDFVLTDKLTFRPGLLFSSKGGKLEVLNEKFTSNFSYLEIPLSLVYKLSGDESGFFVDAGPYVGFLIGAKSGDEDIKDSFESLDFGLNIGIGYDLGNIILGAQYGLGLANIAKDATDDFKTNNKNISIYGIYQF